MGTPVTAAVVRTIFADHYKNGVIPSLAECEPLASYINRALTATGGKPSQLAPDVEPNPIPGAIETTLDAIAAAAARTGAIPGNALGPRLSLLQHELVALRHIIEATPPAPRSQVTDIADTVAFLVLTALRMAGRKIGGIGNNAEAPALLIVHELVERAGHTASPGAIGSLLQRHSAILPKPKRKPAVKLVQELPLKLPQVPD